MFKRKKKKTGCETPEFRSKVPMPPVKPPPPPTSGSNAVKPNPNYVPPASVKKSCPYETPCGWCAKWDKKCDKKIVCDEPPVLKISHSISNEVIATIQDGVYKATMIPEEQLKGNQK